MTFKLSRTERQLLQAVVAQATQLSFPSFVFADGLNFKRICERVPVYACVGMGVVVKQPAFIMTPTTPLKVRVPTIKLEGGWVVQPLLKRTNTSKAVSLIRKKLGNFYCDLHYLNVGWWKGKPLMFDW